MISINPIRTARKKGCHKDGLTLIELLVIIVILAVVLGLLLPALFRAKAQSIKAFCINNLKQLYTASLLYAEDHDGNFPPQDNDLFLTTGRSPAFVAVLYPQYIDSKEAFFCLSSPTKYSETNLTNGNISYGYWGWAWNRSQGKRTSIKVRNMENNSDYWLIMDLLWMGGPPDYPITYQDWYAHKGGSIIVRLSGSIKWFNEGSPTNYWIDD